MRIAVLSDIHANREALEAVLMDTLDRQIERFWFLGDAVGYGPVPAAPLLWLKRNVDAQDWVLGNHDAMLADLLTADEWAYVNESPRKAIELNHKILEEKPEAVEFWQAAFNRETAQPKLHEVDGVNHLLVHSGQGDGTHLFRYVYAWQTEFFLSAECRELQRWQNGSKMPYVQWYGHTHVPTLVTAQPAEDGFAFQSTRILPGQSYYLDSELTLVNPGSVGQPRDLDQRAAYAILDTEARTITFRRVEYEWEKTASALQHDRYPDKLVRRLRTADPTGETPNEWRKHYLQAREVKG